MNKICKKCGSSKPETKDYWYVSKVINDVIYYRGICKECYGRMYRGGDITDLSQDHQYTELDFVNALITLSRNDVARLAQITEREFKAKTGSAEFMNKLKLSFRRIKELAYEHLKQEGYTNPESIVLPPGVYLIVSDSHGKWTKRPMFQLLKHLINDLDVNAVIHVGHLTDDDNDISYLWDNIPLYIVSKAEELKLTQAYINSKNVPWKIARDKIIAGNTIICNQELISDYVRTSLRSLDSQLFEGSTICNLHRLERAPRCTTDSLEYIASPGSLCEPHIVKTVRQIDFKDGYTQKLAYPTGFSKYRKAKQLYRLWSQGLILLKVTSTNTYMLQSRIHTIGKQKACAIFDKIYTSTGIKHPESKLFAVADSHAPEIDLNVIDVQKQIATQFKGDYLVDLGDVISFSSLNHHAIKRGDLADYVNKDIIYECGTAYKLLKERAGWSKWKDKYLLFANHERFCRDFVKKHPQLANLLSVPKLLNLSKLGYSLIDHKIPLRIGPFLFLHGDMVLYGETGRLPDKLSKAFNVKANTAIVFGHTHSAEIRQRAYSVPMSGVLDQLYNETAATYWSQGCALCLSFKNYAFVQILDCINGTSWYKDKVITSTKSFKLDNNNINFSLNYEE